MGMLVEGVWRDDRIQDVEPGRYRLYVAKSCPWAHRTLVLRALKGLEKVLDEGGFDDLYPEKLRREIDWLNERIYRTVNNGVYRAGFATAQDKYEAAVTELFNVRLFTTLVRFDAVYYWHFKCNLRRLVDYPNLWRWTRLVYALPGVAKTVDLKQIKDHFYRSMKHINSTQIVPKGPLLDFRLP